MSMEELNCLKLTNGNPLFLLLFGNDHPFTVVTVKLMASTLSNVPWRLVQSALLISGRHC